MGKNLNKIKIVSDGEDFKGFVRTDKEIFYGITTERTSPYTYEYRVNKQDRKSMKYFDKRFKYFDEAKNFALKNIKKE